MMNRLLKTAILAVLLVAMVPAASVFAETTNTVNKIPTVVPGTELMEGDAPYLRIEEKSVGEFGGEPQEFELILQNAIWPSDAVQRLEAATEGSEAADIVFEQRSETKMGVSITGAGVGVDLYNVKIPLISIVQDAGTARCTVNAMDSAVTDGTYTFAKVAEAEKAVRITMSDLVDASSAAKKFALDDLIIEESAAGALVNSGKNGKVPVKILLQLNDGLEFAAAKFEDSAFGGLSGSVIKGKLKGRNQMVISVDASQRSALKGGIIISGLQLTGRKMESTAEIFIDVKVQSGSFTSERTVLAGTCTVDDLRLKLLSLGGSIDMNPVFNPDVYRYKAVVPKSMDSITLDFASMTFGTPVTLYNESTYDGETVTIPLKVGKNTIKLTVGDPEKGKVSKPYIIEVIRLKK